MILKSQKICYHFSLRIYVKNWHLTGPNPWFTRKESYSEFYTTTVALKKLYLQIWNDVVFSVY